MERDRAGDYVEIYQTSSPVLAQRIVDVVLRPEGIDAMLHDRTDHAFPATGQPGGVFVAVPTEQREAAVRLLTEAQESGYLDADGRLL